MTVDTTIDGTNILVQLGKLAIDLVNDHLRRRLENLMLLKNISFESCVL